MADHSAVPARKPSAELVAIVVFGITVLLAVFSQAAWLGGKIERLGVRLCSEIRDLRDDLGILRDDLGVLRDDLGARIDALQTGQASLDKRLAVVEIHVLGASPVAPTEARAEPAS